MANDYRDRSRFGRDRDSDFDRERFRNRGAFGYEGEGYMRGGSSDFDRSGDRGHGGGSPRYSGSDRFRDDNYGGSWDSSNESGSTRGSGRDYGNEPRGTMGGNDFGSGYNSDAGYRGGGYLGGGFSGGSNRGPVYGGQSGGMNNDYTGPRDDDRGGFRSNAYGDFNQGDYARSSSDYDRTGGDYARGGTRFGASGGDYARGTNDHLRGSSEFLRGGGMEVSHRGRGPKGYQRSDERIREDVCERLERDHHVDASDIEVRVEAAVVILSGTVDDRATKRRAEDIAESIGGVHDVQNHLHVSRGRSHDDDDVPKRDPMTATSAETPGGATGTTGGATSSGASASTGNTNTTTSTSRGRRS